MAIRELAAISRADVNIVFHSMFSKERRSVQTNFIDYHSEYQNWNDNRRLLTVRKMKTAPSIGIIRFIMEQKQFSVNQPPINGLVS
jgi:hypothetical protein